MIRLLVLLASAATVAPAGAQWKASQTKDPITDEVTTAFLLTSSNSVPNAIGTPIRPTLIVRCAGGEFTDLYVVTGGYVGDEAKVQYRLDEGTPTEQLWSGGRARDAVFYSNRDPSLLWLTIIPILSGKRLVFRWFPPMEDARTASFLVGGFDALPQASLKACGRDKATLSRLNQEREEMKRLVAGKAALIASLQSDDNTLPWAGKRDGALYWRNVPGCWHSKNDPRRSDWVYFREESSAVAAERSRSTEEGC